jgi:DNA helicase HerA-like ATPase
MPKDPTLLGTVQDVQGATISIALSGDTVPGLAFINGHGYRIGQVASFVRIPIGFIDLFGIISQVGASALPERLASELPGRRWMTVQLIGESHQRGEFRRGLSQFPTIGDTAHLVTEQDLARIYGRPDAHNFVKIGHLASAESIPALIDINKLITRHSAVVGATGAGKSTTVAGLLLSLSDKKSYPSARIIIIDIHGEYSAALKDQAVVFRINPNANKDEEPLFVPYWAMTFDELLPITLGLLDDASRGGLLEKIMSLKLAAIELQSKSEISSNNLTVDTPVPFSIHKLWYDLHCLMNATHTSPPTGQSMSTMAFEVDEGGEPVQKGDPMKVIAPKFKPQTQASGAEKIYISASNLNFRRPLESLASKLRDPRFDFLFRPGPWAPNVEGQTKEDLDSLLKKWIGGPQPIAILDLSGVPANILTNLVGALLRIVYDALFWGRKLSEGGRERPLLIVLEEAHVYLGQSDVGPAATIVKKIVKEGRKYGIGAMIVSQRPSEIDATILSQCGTIFSMRLSNSSDRAHVTGTVSDNLEGLFNSLPILRIGEAIIVGEAVHLPVRTIIDPPPASRRPDSSDPLVYDDNGPGGWNRGKEKSDYAEMVTMWRKQEYRSPRIIVETTVDAKKNEVKE